MTVPGPDPTIGAITYSPAAGTVLGAGPQTLTVNVAATADYAADSYSVPLTVNKTNPRITWATPAYIVQGTPLGSSQLDAVVTVPGPDPTIGTITYAPPAGTVLAAGLGQALTVNVAATVDYNAASGSVPIDVKYASSLGTLSQPTITYGAASTTLSGQVTSVGGPVPIGQVAITLGNTTQFASIDPSTGDFSSSFNTATLGASGSPYTITYAYQGSTTVAASSGTGSLTVNKATPVITWAAPAAITYGTPLGGAQLDAMITAPDQTYGSVTYSPDPECGVRADADRQRRRLGKLRRGHRLGDHHRQPGQPVDPLGPAGQHPQRDRARPGAARRDGDGAGTRPNHRRHHLQPACGHRPTGRQQPDLNRYRGGHRELQRRHPQRPDQRRLGHRPDRQRRSSAPGSLLRRGRRD